MNARRLRIYEPFPGARTVADENAVSDELAKIRVALAQAVAKRSLRAVAKEVGMSPTGLTGLLQGTAPYGKTWDKLRRWYGEPRQAGSSPGLVADILKVMVSDLPEPDRASALDQLMRSLSQIYQHAGVAFPGWVGEVRQMLKISDGDP